MCGKSYGWNAGIWLIMLGLFFIVGFRWELILVAVGASMLLTPGYRGRYACGPADEEKPKRKNDDYI